jgi:hypothetical protein
MDNPNDSLYRFAQEQKDKFKEFDDNLTSARLVSRDVIYKIILICSSIIGFSLTLISIPNLELKSDINQLRTSWNLFLYTIILGFISIFIEGRLHYALHWRSFQVQDYDEDYSYPFIDKLKVWFVCLYSLIFPRNLILCRIYKTKEEKRYYALLNAKAVMTLAELEKLTFILENVFVTVFIFALSTFVRSYK